MDIKEIPNTDLFYCKKWWLTRNIPADIISCEEAEKLHNEKLPYTAVVKQGTVTKVINVYGKGVLVNFIDERGNLFLLYDFQQEDEERLFLKGVIHYEYDTDNRRVKLILFNFQKDGRVLMESHDYLSGETVQKEAFTDLKANREDFPKFGSYERLMTEDRGMFI